VVSAAGTHGSRRVGPRGWHRSESRAIAVRVRSGSSSGVPRIPPWLQKSSSSVWLREATPVAAGVGDGGLAQSGDRRRRSTLTGPEPETASDPSVREEPLDGGRRLGSWQPLPFTGKRRKRSWPGDWWPQAPRRLVTEASESRQVHGHGRRRGDHGRGFGWTKRATRRESRRSRRAVAVAGRSLGARL